MLKVTIRIVETMCHDGLTIQEMVNWTAERITDISGGVTTGTETTGYWKDNDGILVKEKGVDLVTYTESHNVVKLQNVALWLKEIGKQDCVLFVVEDVKAVNFV